jgi:hypothetical protein
MRKGKRWRRFPGPRRRFGLVQRVRIVLLAAQGLPSGVIAARLGVCEDTDRKWEQLSRPVD